MFVWRGFGLAVVGITFLALVLTEFSVERIVSDDAYYQDHGWPKFVALASAAALVWLLSNRLDKRPGQVVIDKATGQKFTLPAKHDLFFVPLRYWPGILVLAGLGFAIFG